MATTQNLFINRTRKRLGSQVFYTWKTKNVIRSMPKKYTDKSSTAQVQVRTRIKMLANIWNENTPIYPTYWKVASRKMTPYNAFIQQTINTGAAVRSGLGAVMDYTKFQPTPVRINNVKWDLLYYDPHQYQNCQIQWEKLGNLYHGQEVFLQILMVSVDMEVWAIIENATIMDTQDEYEFYPPDYLPAAPMYIFSWASTKDHYFSSRCQSGLWDGDQWQTFNPYL